MSTLTSASTNAEVWASYDDNASYEEDSSRTKALAFITACRILLRRRPSRQSQDGSELEFDVRAITGEMEQAREWLALNPAASTGSIRATRFASMENFRD